MATGRLPDPNTAPLTAKGDLYTYSTVPARLAVGSNGDTLVADSSQTTGLRWGNNYGFTAGKNKIINGDFRINQRAFSSTTVSGTFGFDRWIFSGVDGTTTYSAQTFTLGTAPVAGYEGTNFARIVSSGQTATNALSALRQPIESVRTFAGQTITVSFWAKASTGTPNVVVWASQVFGSGGSPSSAVETGSTKQAITTSWARYSFTMNIPSIAGKTLGTDGADRLVLLIVTSAGSDRAAYTDSIGIQSATIDIWGVQAETGSVATAFQTATGTLAGELAACQRYFWRAGGGHNTVYGIGSGGSTTSIFPQVIVPVTMRTKSPILGYSNVRLSDFGAAVTPSALVIYTTTGGDGSVASGSNFQLNATVAGATAYRPYHLQNADNTAGYLQFDAEL